MGIRDKNVDNDATDAIKGWKLNFALASASPAASDFSDTQGQDLSALSEGQMYFDSTNDLLKVYDGSSWISIGDFSAFGGTLDAVASAGKKVTSVTAVEIEASTVSDALLILDANAGTGDCLQIENAGTGDSISVDDGGTVWYKVGKGGDKVVEMGASSVLSFVDNAELRLGTGNDFVIDYDGSNLVVLPAADDDGIVVGDGTTDADLTWYMGAAGQQILLDASAATIDLEGVDLNLRDSDVLAFGDANDITVTWDGTDLIVEGAAQDSVVKLGVTNSLDVWLSGNTATDTIKFDSSAPDLTFNGVDISLEDSDVLNFGDSDDVQMRWDGTDFDVLFAADNSVVKIGVAAGNTPDIWLHGAGANDNIILDSSGNTLKLDGIDLTLEDDDILALGDSNDVTLNWDSAAPKLEMLFAADATSFEIGASGGNCTDITWYSAANTVVADEGASTVTFNGVDLSLEDSDLLLFGDSDDVTMRWDGTDFDVLAAADDAIFKFGNGTNSFDVWIYGETASDYVLFDAGATKISLAGAYYVEPTAIADPGNAGAIPVTVAGYCPLVTAAGETRTLADPSYDGQVIDLFFKTDAGDCVVTAASPVNQAGNNTLTFADEGDHIKLIGYTGFTVGGAEWRVVANDGVALSTV